MFVNGQNIHSWLIHRFSQFILLCWRHWHVSDYQILTKQQTSIESLLTVNNLSTAWSELLPWTTWTNPVMIRFRWWTVFFILVNSYFPLTNASWNIWICVSQARSRSNFRESRGLSSSTINLYSGNWAVSHQPVCSPDQGCFSFWLFVTWSSSSTLPDGVCPHTNTFTACQSLTQKYIDFFSM